MKVLLVEPDKIIGGSIKDALQNDKCNVLWRRSAQSALDELDINLPDLIILELQLGLHNGIEFLFEINSYPEWQLIPVIIHTINSKAQDSIYEKTFSQLNVKAVLYKPRTSTKQLVSMVQNYSMVT